MGLALGPVAAIAITLVVLAAKPGAVGHGAAIGTAWVTTAAVATPEGEGSYL